MPTYNQWFVLLVRRWSNGSVTCDLANQWFRPCRHASPTVVRQWVHCSGQVTGWTMFRISWVGVQPRYKSVHALFSFNPVDKMSISHIQRLASILSRHMRPDTHTMHIITNGYNQPHVKIHLSDLAQSDVMMWRAFVLLLIAQPDRLLRTMESFRPQSADYCIKYDASLTGLGIWQIASW